MPAPAPSWNTHRVFATWNRQDGTRREGTYKVTIPVRVTNATDDVIVPAGVFATGSLVTTPGVPSLDVAIPSNDDPDNSPNGWQPIIEVTFPDAAGEKYLLDTPVDGETNLRTVVLAASLPVPVTVLIRDVPGGLATLDDEGKLKPTQVPDDIGGASTVDELTDATTVGKAVVKATDAGAARTAIGAGTSSLALGTTSTTAKAGDYQPTAENISNSTTVGRNVLKATDAAAARTAIGAGTSNVAIGTTSGTAADAATMATELAARAPKTGTLGTRVKSGSTDLGAGPGWPLRPTGYASVLSVGADPSPTDQTGGDLRWIPA